MKKILMKSILAFMLAFTMVLANVPLLGGTLVAHADDNKCGDNVTWAFDKSTGVLTISGTGAMHDYPENAPWDGIRDQISSVVIKEGVECIGINAFKLCINLETVSIPGSIYKIVGTDVLPFEGCSKLKAINVSDGNANYKSIDGVLYELDENKVPKTLLLCPYAKTGTITVPATVIRFRAYSFYSDSGKLFTSLDRIEFEPRDEGNINLEYFAMGKSRNEYKGDCVLVAPEGMCILDAKEVPYEDTFLDTALTFRKETKWDELLSMISKGGKVTLTSDYDFTKDSYSYERYGKTYYYGNLKVPEDTVLDLNGHTLTAITTLAEGSLTIKNGTLNSKLNNDIKIDEKTFAPLILDNVNVTMKTIDESNNYGLDWYGSISLVQSTVKIPEKINIWLPPEKEEMLTMDETSGITCELIDISKVYDTDLHYMALFEYQKTESETKESIEELYQSKLGKFLPEGYKFEAKNIGIAPDHYMVSVKDKDGNYPDSVTFKAPAEEKDPDKTDPDKTDPDKKDPDKKDPDKTQSGNSRTIVEIEGTDGIKVSYSSEITFKSKKASFEDGDVKLIAKDGSPISYKKIKVRKASKPGSTTFKIIKPLIADKNAKKIVSKMKYNITIVPYEVTDKDEVNIETKSNGNIKKVTVNGIKLKKAEYSVDATTVTFSGRFKGSRKRA